MASVLYQEYPEAYRILSEVRIPAHASGNESMSIRPVHSFPVLHHDPETGNLMQIRWNNDDRAAVSGTQMGRMDDWYEAARRWVEILRREEAEYWEQLKPGTPLSMLISFQTGYQQLGGKYVDKH